jgi:hypothetical protein
MDIIKLLGVEERTACTERDFSHDQNKSQEGTYLG